MNSTIFSSALVPISLIIANLTAFVTQLALAHILAPDEYAKFASWLATTQFITVLAFEWLRLSTIRFSMSANRIESDSNRSVLRQGYYAVGGCLIISSVVLCLGSTVFAIPISLAVMLFAATCQGMFEGNQASLRAQFLNKAFSINWLLRTSISLILTLAAAEITRNAALTLASFSSSYILAFFVFYKSPPRSTSNHAPHFPLRFFFSYGSFAAIAGIISSFFIAAIRIATNAYLAPATAGGVLLALDLSQKAILITGLAINIVLVQQSIKIEEFGSEFERERQKSLQISIPIAILLPTAIGFYLIQPELASLIIPLPLRHAYLSSILPSTVIGTILAFRIYSLDPMFVIQRQTKLAIIGPLIATTISLITFFTIHNRASNSSSEITTAAIAGLSTSLIATGVIIRAMNLSKIPIKDISRTMISSLLMATCVSLVPDSHPVLNISNKVLVGIISYGIFSFLLDTLSVRSKAFPNWRRIRSHRSPRA